MPSDTKLSALGLRPDWRGQVAYAASPWWWKPRNCERLVMLACLLTGAGVGAELASGRPVGAVIAFVVNGLLFMVPSVRSLRRQRELDR